MKIGFTDLIRFSVRLQFWLGGREHPLKDLTESPPTRDLPYSKSRIKTFG